MDNELCIKIADEISDKLISLWKNKQTNNKNIMDLYNQILDEKYKENQYYILSYVPERLSIKGYEIVNSNNFELKKY